VVSRLRLGTCPTAGCAALLAALLLAPGVALADPAAAERDAARAMMDHGDQLLEAKDYPGALKAYQAADTIMHVPTTGIEVAKTQASMGQLLAARETALAVAALPERPDEPAPFAEARAEAQRMATALEARIPVLEIRIDGVDGATLPRLEVDGAPVPAALFAVPRRVDPGNHVVVAILAGYQDARSEVSVREGEKGQVTLSMVPGASSAKKKASLFGLSVLSLAGFGAGAAGLAVGALTGVVSLSEASAVKARCFANRCAPSTAGELGSARAFGVASDVFFGLGLAGIGVGVVGIVLSPREGAAQKPEAPPPLAAQVFVGPGSLELRGSF
jgi:hypothetical protein